VRYRTDDGVAYGVWVVGRPRQRANHGDQLTMSRTLLDIDELDSRVQDEIAEHGSIKDFHIVLWRHEPDVTGSNWNARIERTGADQSTPSWWDVVPKMRERFNLS
jgi:hypothetical protein